MKGLLFYDNYTFVTGECNTIHKKWCVKIGEKKVHIDSSYTRFSYAEPERTVFVKLCDGSCEIIEEISKEDWEVVLPLIEKL